MHEFVQFNPNLTYDDDDDKSQIIQLKIRTAAAAAVVAPKNIFCVFWGY